MRLGKWQWVWVVFSALFLIPMGWVGMLSWDHYSLELYEDLRCMSTVVLLEKHDVSVREQLDCASAWKGKRFELQAQISRIQQQYGNNVDFGTIEKHYAEEVASLPRLRILIVLVWLAIWLVCIGIAYGFGWTVGWIIENVRAK